MDSRWVGLMCLVLFGCAREPRLLDDLSDKTSLLSDRIVIRASSPSSEYHWVLEKNGKSKGTLHFVPNKGDPGTTTHYEFPAGIHDEFLAKLEETGFFRMQSAHGKGDSKATIEVHYHGKKHTVTQTGAAEIDDGFNKMWIFLGDVQRRSTVVVPPQPK
jgi:hypothetical protein